MYWYNSTSRALENQEEMRGKSSLPQLFEKMCESARAKLQHPRSPGDLADRNAEIFGDIALRYPPMQCLDELPPLGKRCDFLR